MTVRFPLGFALALLIASALACGGRSVATSDGAALAPDGALSSDAPVAGVDLRLGRDRSLAAPDAGKPKICAANSDCSPGHLCQHDGICIITGAIAGQCKPLPSCPDTGAKCQTVCGCDGTSYCSACDAHAAGVSVATQGACLAPTCAVLQAAYAAEVKLLKQCCTFCFAEQCQLTVPGDLACGCLTYVNKASSPAMQAIAKEWQVRGCGLGINCPPVACGPTHAECENGSCVDHTKP